MESLDWFEFSRTTALFVDFDFERILSESNESSEKRYGRFHSMMNSLATTTVNFLVKNDYRVIQKDVYAAFVKPVVECNGGLELTFLSTWIDYYKDAMCSVCLTTEMIRKDVLKQVLSSTS